MRNPFPGIDPYLEAQGLWPDFHSKFINYWQEALADGLPDSYEVRIGERVNVVEYDTGRTQRFGPDLALQHKPGESSASHAPAGVATLEPVTIPIAIEEETRETYLRILHRPNRSLVAVLELLSPANKEEPGRSSYLAKRNALLRQPVHLVELDFLLGGQRLPLTKDYPAGHGFALIAHADRRPDCDVYAWTIRQPIPAVPIPLRAPDPPVWSNLAAVFDLAYERGRYARSIDPSSAPSGTLAAEVLAWILQTANVVRS